MDKPKINENFYGVNKDVLLEFRPIEKRLSCNFLNYDYEDELYRKVANTFFVKHFYSLFNYVTGETSPYLSIKVDEDLSCCGLDKNFIQLGTRLLGDDAFSQQQKVDAVFAIMLHEMFHKRFTVSHIASEYAGLPVSDYYSRKENNALLNQLLKIKSGELFKNVFNILEDRRIERLGLIDFPGYVFYFDQKRDLALNRFFRKNYEGCKVGQLVMEYLMYEVLLPELSVNFSNVIDELYDRDKTIEAFFDIRDKLSSYILANRELVFSSDMDDVLRATAEICDLIPEDIFEGIAPAEYCNVESEFFVAIPGSGGEGGHERLQEIVDEEINKELDKLDGEDKTGRVEKIEIVEVADERFNHVEIYNPKCNTVDADILRRAKKMSYSIAKNLGYLSSKLNGTRTDYELTEGDIDEDELYSIKYSKNIFSQDEETTGFEFDLCIFIDESGSMQAMQKRNNAVIAALACILAAKDSQHVNLFVYGHSYGRHELLDSKIELYEYFNKKKGVTNWTNVFAVTARGNNVDGYAILKMGEIMLKSSTAKKKIMVVISDGQPHAPGYMEEPAEKHTRKAVQLLEDKGIYVLQICIDNIERSEFMFKHFIPFDNIGNFIKKFGDFIRKTLVKFSENI